MAGQAYGNAVGTAAPAELEDDVVVVVSIATMEEVDTIVYDDGGCTSVTGEVELETGFDRVSEDVIADPTSEDEEVVDMSMAIEVDSEELDADAVVWLSDPDDGDDADISISIELLDDELVGISAEDEPVELDTENVVVVSISTGPAEEELVEAASAEEVELVVGRFAEKVELENVIDIDEDELVVVVVVVVVIMALSA